MELKQIKKNIWYILTIIGTSCGVIGGFFSCAVLAHELEAWFIFWSSIVTVVGMVISVINWGVKLIIEIRKYRQEKKLASGVWITPKMRLYSDAEKGLCGLGYKKEKTKGGGKC